jgi:hypothetical protein
MVGASLHDYAADFVYDLQRMLPTEFARTNRPHVLAAAALWLAGEEPPAPPACPQLNDLSEICDVPALDIIRYTGLTREARRMSRVQLLVPAGMPWPTRKTLQPRARDHAA